VRETLAAILVFLLLSAWAMAQATGSIRGIVTNSSGARIFGALVAVERADGSQSMTVTDGEGAFKFSSLTPGNYSVKISAAGMFDWSDVNVPASATPEPDPVLAVLQVSPEVTTVTVRPSTFTQHRPDVTLLDLDLPHAEGVSALQEILRIDAAACVLGSMTYEEDESCKHALRAGARSCVTKDRLNQDLVSLIRGCAGLHD
jgi:CheY-like chemotaxis protein